MLPPGIDPKGTSVEERFQHRKKLPLLKPDVIDQCLPGLRLIRAPDRSREQAPQLLPGVNYFGRSTSIILAGGSEA